MASILSPLHAILAQVPSPAQGSNQVTWLDTVLSGGPIAYIIIALSVVAMILIVLHFVQIRSGAIMPVEQLELLEAYFEARDVDGALEYCVDPVNDSYLTRVLSPGLMRLKQSAFGSFELRTCIEDAGSEETARLYRSTDALGVIGAVAPLLGLLGTVFGMVGAFQSLSHTAGSNHEELAANISVALVTTLLGLILAIPCVAFYTFFRNRIDAIGAEAGSRVDRFVQQLGEGGQRGAS